MFGHFHFIQPLWLLALLPLAGILWLIARHHHANNPWRKLVDAQLLPLLMDEQKTHRSKMPIWLLSVGWLLAVLALADPTWEQKPQPLRQTSSSRVLVLDLSRSMLAPDLKPSRLVRARFKVEDILAHDAEGQTGLVVFAGDAFTVSPLTRDADTIRAQLRALHPSIMPSQGSRADLGLLKALELLHGAGVKNAQVILIADGVEGDKTISAARQLRDSGFEVSVLGVGTPDGAPIPDGRGGTLRDTAGKPLLPRLDDTALASIAQAGDGRYSRLHGDQSDINTLLQARTADADKVEADDLQAQQWEGQGPLLAVLLLPLAALAFRRGWLFSVLLCAGTLVPPQPAMAFGWDQLWQRSDQQAAQALQDGEYEQAARLAEDPAQRGSAYYRQGEYEKAMQAFDRAPGTDASYNRGNALARMGKYKQAIAAYDEALKLQPGMQDALTNKAAVEALLNQQQQNKQASSDQQDDQDPSSQQQQGSSGQDDPEQQEQNAQTDSDGGDQEGSSQPDEQQASDAQSGDGEGTEQQPQSDSANQFADANRELDKGQDEAQPEPSAEAQRQETETEQQHAEQAMSEQVPPSDQQERSQSPGSPSEAEALSNEEQMAAQQWLRRIPDDPGGLLRRKFLYQYRQRARSPDSGSHQDW